MFPKVADSTISSMVPSKTAVQTVRVMTHSEQTVSIYVVEGEPLFVDNDGFVFPTGKCCALILHFCDWCYVF